MIRPRCHSLTLKLFLSVVGCVLFVLLTVILLNTFALKGYYIRQKRDGISHAFSAVNAACDDADELKEALTDLQDNQAVTVILFSEDRLLYSTLNSERFRILGSIPYEKGTYEVDLIRQDAMMAGGNAADTAIRLIGTLDNGWHIYLRTPIAAIEENIAITNRFLLLTGGIALLAGMLLVSLVSRQYSLPIRELSAVADRVAKLDFSGRYTGRQQDEIGDLGNSINTMSAALEQTVTQLKNANARLTADIRQKEKLDASRRAFIANVSHELKTPIALIATYAEGLRENVAAGGNDRQYYCTVIEDEAHRINQMLRRMMLLMQLEGGEEPLAIERFDIAELLYNLLEKNRPQFEQKSITLFPVPADPVFVYADPYLIENVLTNFLSNALHHTPAAGCVRTRLEPVQNNTVRLTVYNSGDPIPPDDLPHLWESFYKADKAHSRSYGGSGIGLSVVAAIMNAHAMPYGVQNCADGVEFYIELETR